MIGAQIAAYRKQKDLTQEQLGEMLGVSNRTVSKWESETSLPGVDMIPNIAEALGVTLDALFGIKSDPDEKDLPDLLRDTVRQELESLLPDAVENAIQKSCGNLPQPEKYELIVEQRPVPLHKDLRRSKYCFRQYFREMAGECALLGRPPEDHSG